MQIITGKIVKKVSLVSLLGLFLLSGLPMFGMGLENDGKITPVRKLRFSKDVCTDLEKTEELKMESSGRDFFIGKGYCVQHILEKVVDTHKKRPMFVQLAQNARKKGENNSPRSILKKMSSSEVGLRKKELARITLFNGEQESKWNTPPFSYSLEQEILKNNEATIKFIDFSASELAAVVKHINGQKELLKKDMQKVLVEQVNPMIIMLLKQNESHAENGSNNKKVDRVLEKLGCVVSQLNTMNSTLDKDVESNDLMITASLVRLYATSSVGTFLDLKKRDRIKMQEGLRMVHSACSDNLDAKLWNQMPLNRADVWSQETEQVVSYGAGKSWAKLFQNGLFSRTYLGTKNILSSYAKMHPEDPYFAIESDRMNDVYRQVRKELRYADSVDSCKKSVETFFKTTKGIITSLPFRTSALLDIEGKKQ